MPARAVIFDLDGTLLDTLTDIANAANKSLAQLGQPPHPESDYKIYVGEGADVLARRVLPADKQTLAPEMLRLYAANYSAHAFDHTAPYPGIIPLLDALTQRGIALAVLTNKLQAATEQVMQRYFPNHHFAALHGHREGVPKKPDPAPALQLARDINVAPQNCIFVGDSKTDMLTARAAGMTAVGCLWGFRDRKELIENGAQHLIATPIELLALL